MADEITLNLKIKYAKNGIEDSRSFSDTVDVSGSGTVGGVQTIGTAAHEALILNDVATPGYCRVLNIDATNYVEIGVDGTGTFYPTLKLKAGECAVFRFGTTAPYAKANTGAVKLEYMIFEA